MPVRTSRRLLVGLVAAIAALSACDDAGVTPTTSPQPTSTQALPGQVLVYGFEPGDIYTYSVELSQHIVLSSEGSAEAVAEQDIPGEVDVTVTAEGTFVYTASAAASGYSLAIDGKFDNVSVTGTADGETVDDPSDLPQLGTIQPISEVIEVDGRGRVISDPATTPAIGATPLTGLGGDLVRWVGPVLTDEPVSVGSTWTENSTDPTLGDEPVETTLTATLGGTETVEDTETLVIEIESTTGQADIDLAEFFAGFVGAFADPDDPESEAKGKALADQLVFHITIAPSSSEGTAWFDPEAGLALRSVSTGPPTVFDMEVALPDEDTGELETYNMHLELTQTLEYSLVP